MKTISLKLGEVEKAAKRLKDLLQEQLDYEEIVHPSQSILGFDLADKAHKCFMATDELVQAMEPEFSPEPIEQIVTPWRQNANHR